MDPETAVLALVALGFFLAAYAHTSVGLGGGSSYTAIQSLAGFPVAFIPSISLVFNLLATSLGSFNFIRGGHFGWRRLTPFLLGSMPCAWIGGLLVLPERAFLTILLASLLAVLVRLLLLPLQSDEEQVPRESTNPFAWWAVGILIGAVLGFVAGVVGIGGGIYLVPLIIILGRGTAQQAAACGAVFIWINSALGLGSRLFHHGWPPEINRVLLVLVPAVALGAWFGSRHGALKWSRRAVERALCAVIALACFFLVHRIVE